MPEGPELYKAAKYLNKIAGEYLFSTVRLLYEPSTKRPAIPWEKPVFHLSAVSRGKEIQISLVEDLDGIKTRGDKKPDVLKILLTFGMTGRFAFTPVAEVQKHSMLMFDTTCKKHTFAFVDSRHFGRWCVSDLWSPLSKRGPDIISEYQLFRSHVLNSLDKPLFDRPICEVLLDQRYFSAIGNYLRAEVLFRLDIDPFVSAREVLQDLPEVHDHKKENETTDLLYTCHKLCWEVINLPGSGKPYDPYGIFGDWNVFEDWLQCYTKEGMSNSIDDKQRTIWHDPKYGKGKHRRHRVIKKADSVNEVSDVDEDTVVKENDVKFENKNTSTKKRKRRSTKNKLASSKSSDKENVHVVRNRRNSVKSPYFSGNKDKDDKASIADSEYFTSSGRRVKRTKL